MKLLPLLLAVLVTGLVKGYTALSSPSPSEMKDYLHGHNVIRREHGAGPLVWDQGLSDAADSWVSKCVFMHSNGLVGPYGENLAAGTGPFDIRAAVKAWTDEASDYDPSNPQASHYTQVVWKSTTKVGCSVRNCTTIFPAIYGVAKFYAREYSTPVNVHGQYTENV